MYGCVALPKTPFEDLSWALQLCLLRGLQLLGSKTEDGQRPTHGGGNPQKKNSEPFVHSKTETAIVLRK